jgi:nucleotide-binding universal stress UspA family protein
MSETIIAGVDVRRPDDMRDALALASRLAPLAHAELLVVAVLAPTRGVEVARVEREVGEIMEAVIAEAGVASSFSVRAVPAKSPARVLYEFCERTRAVAVVIGASLRAPEGRALPGSVAESLLHGAGSPVVVAPRGFASREHTGLRLIGVGFEETPEAQEALRHAVSLATAGGADLRVLSVVEPFLFSHMAMAREHEALEVEHALESRARASLEAAVAALPAEISAEPVLLDGAIVPTLTRLSSGLDLLVLGSRGYGASRAVLLGPVSRDLVHRAACPVMVVPRPPVGGDDAAVAGGVAGAVEV